MVSFFLLPVAHCQAFSAQTVKFESEIKEGLVMPLDVAFNASGQLIVFDAGKNIFAFDNEGKKQLSFVTDNSVDSVEPVAVVGSMAILPNGRLVIVKSGNKSRKFLDLVVKLYLTLASKEVCLVSLSF